MHRSQSSVRHAAQENVASQAVPRPNPRLAGRSPQQSVDLSNDLVTLVRRRTAGSALERFHVAMSLAAVMLVVAAAVIYQGTIAQGTFDAYFAVGIGCVAAAVVVFLAERRRLLGHLQIEAENLGHERSQARQLARRALTGFLRAKDERNETNDNRP